ncbi:hypothetical protein EJ08DRAFT_666465 [Tothia fuscella]|uniref:Uncharacterized protein n=1 Tax=Tothia fuscella TaxID=1048955 RepID=A0A9P4NEH1_9PEZI|nr:hypothetical protein EJ08DRAFT_666465 [Tothia fuscella]
MCSQTGSFPAPSVNRSTSLIIKMEPDDNISETTEVQSERAGSGARLTQQSNNSTHDDSMPHREDEEEESEFSRAETPATPNSRTSTPVPSASTYTHATSHSIALISASSTQVAPTPQYSSATSEDNRHDDARAASQNLYRLSTSPCTTSSGPQPFLERQLPSYRLNRTRR